MKRIVSLIIALVMALSLCAYAEDAAGRTLLMTVDDENVYQDQVQEIAELLYQYGYTDGINMAMGLKYPSCSPGTYRRTCWARNGTTSLKRST